MRAKTLPNPPTPFKDGDDDLGISAPENPSAERAGILKRETEESISAARDRAGSRE